MQAIFRPEAEQEIFEAQDWYESCSPGLGYEFARAVEFAVESAIRMPLGHPQIEGDYRHVILRRFPAFIINENHSKGMAVGNDRFKEELATLTGR